MATTNSEHIIRSLFETAGIQINGNNPYDIYVHNPRFYRRALGYGVLGFGESYMDGWWDCEALDQFTDRILRADLEKQFMKNWTTFWHVFKSRIINRQKLSRAYQVGESHYDAGNDLYQAMLDRRLNYTCAYWKNARDLDEAQEAKLELVCKKLGLKPGMRILDLGCGWGSFAKYAAENYHVEVLGVTVSKEQVELGNQLCQGLPVELQLQDYRNVKGQYDRVISIGIMEHVGYKNYRTYMQVVDRTLKNNGIAFVHTIGRNESKIQLNPWIDKYIFPNGMIPSIAQLGKAMDGFFVMEDWHNFGPDYDRTLMAWYTNFEAAWPELSHAYDERFRRMWIFYLLSSAGSFRSRTQQLWQLVMTRPGSSQPDCRFV